MQEYLQERDAYLLVHVDPPRHPEVPQVIPQQNDVVPPRHDAPAVQAVDRGLGAPIGRLPMFEVVEGASLLVVHRAR